MIGQTLYLRKPSDDERLRIYDKQKRTDFKKKACIKVMFLRGYEQNSNLGKKKLISLLKNWLKVRNRTC